MLRNSASWPLRVQRPQTVLALLRTGAFAPSGLPAPSVVMAYQGRPFTPKAACTGFLRKSSCPSPAPGNTPPAANLVHFAAFLRKVPLQNGRPLSFLRIIAKGTHLESLTLCNLSRYCARCPFKMADLCHFCGFFCFWQCLVCPQIECFITGQSSKKIKAAHFVTEPGRKRQGIDNLLFMPRRKHK